MKLSVPILKLKAGNRAEVCQAKSVWNTARNGPIARIFLFGCLQMLCGCAINASCAIVTQFVNRSSVTKTKLQNFSDDSLRCG